MQLIVFWVDIKDIKIDIAGTGISQSQDMPQALLKPAWPPGRQESMGLVGCTLKCKMHMIYIYLPKSLQVHLSTMRVLSSLDLFRVGWVSPFRILQLSLNMAPFQFSAEARRPNAVKLVELLKAKKGPLKSGGRSPAAQESCPK